MIWLGAIGGETVSGDGGGNGAGDGEAGGSVGGGSIGGSGVGSAVATVSNDDPTSSGTGKGV